MIADNPRETVDLDEFIEYIAEEYANPTQSEQQALELDQFDGEYPGQETSEDSARGSPVNDEHVGVQRVNTNVDAVQLAGFLDATQRTLPWTYIETEWGYAPIHLSLSSVAIVGPDHRVEDGPAVRYGLIGPTSNHVPKSIDHRFGDATYTSAFGQAAHELSLEIDENSRGDQACPPVAIKGALDDVAGLSSGDRFNRQVLRQRNANKSSHIRKELEEACSLAKMQSLPKHEWLLVDGRLPGLGMTYGVGRQFVGVAKRHLGTFLEPREELEIFEGLDVGCRSHVFLADGERDAVSCYLKIRDLTEYTHDVMAGIVRVEIFQEHADNIDRICNAILDHAGPIKMDGNAWENTLYPIYLCEQIAGSRMSEEVTRIEAIMRSYGSQL